MLLYDIMPKKNSSLDYYMKYLIDLNSHKIKFDEPLEKISNKDKKFFLTHDESKPIKKK